MAWIPIAASVVGSALSDSGGGGGGGGGGGPAYVPPSADLAAANTGWQQAFQGQQGIVGQTAGQVQPLYGQTLAAQQGINYQPYQQAAQQAGGQYGWLANLAGQQGQQFGQMAGQTGAQQQALYGAGNQVYQTALDPQNALFRQTQQTLQDQIRAGQAARGLGTSPVGAAEENQAMGQFDINWQNQQLARQAQGVQAMSQASQAGGAQGQLTGANLAAQMGVYGQQPGFTQQSAGVPLQAQQYVAGQPAAAASQYQTGMGQLANMYGGLAGQALPYMYQGQGAQQTQQQFNAQQQAATANMWGQLGQKAAPTVQSWLGGQGGSDPYAAMSQGGSLYGSTADVYNPAIANAVWG